MMRYSFRLGLLVVGMASATLGIVYWQHVGFVFEGLWFENGFKLHPLHLVAVGVIIVPPTMLDIFALDGSRPSAAPTAEAEHD